MENSILIEPDEKFINEITSVEGVNLKKCYQCATCSVACTASHDTNPFPRKEMIFASWGLKDKLIANPDIWLCYNCGDCSTMCPRDARPGDVLNALRKMTIKEYSKPAFLNKLLNEPKMIPLLFIIPALIILGLGFVTGLMNINPVDGPIVFANFFPVALIETIFLPLTVITAIVFFLGIKRFIGDMQKNNNGSTTNKLNITEFIKTMVKIFPSIMKHDKFSSCSENKTRKLSHILVSFSFVSLAFVAGVFVIALYILNSHGPYPQINPVKILANFSGIALITGSILLIKERLSDKKQTNSYFDWYLLGLALFLGITGMLTQIFRLLDLPTTAYITYFIHIMFAFNLVAFLPYTKLAHLVYRTVAVTYYEYSNKK